MQTGLPLLPLTVSVAFLLGISPAKALPPSLFTLVEVAKVGDAVPTGSTGEVFTKFYTPATNNDGDFGLLVATKDTAGIKRQTFLNITEDFSASTRVFTKDDVLAEAPSIMVRSLKTPAFNAQGSMAAIVKLRGTTATTPPAVTSLDDSAIGFIPGAVVQPPAAGTSGEPPAGSPMHIVARENQVAPGTSGAYRAFKTLVLGDGSSPEATRSADAGTNGGLFLTNGTLFFFASLKKADTTITSANDYGVWTYSQAAGAQALLVEGKTYNVGLGDVTLSAFKTLMAPSLGYSQGHSVRENTLVALARFSDRTRAIVQASEGGGVDPVVVTGNTVPDSEDITYTTLGVPSLGNENTTTVLAKLSNKTFRIVSISGKSTTVRLDSASAVPGFPNAVLKSVRDPQINAQNDFVTLGKLSGSDSSTAPLPITSVNDEVIVGNLGGVQPTLNSEAGTNGGLPPASYQIFAREGDPAPGTQATFDRFRSILLADRELGGFFFTATLTFDGINVTSANNDGIWSYSPIGGLQKVVREGDTVDFGEGPTFVTKIVAFKAVSGSADHQRSGNSSGRVLVLLRTQTPTASSVYRVVSIERGSVPL